MAPLAPLDLLLYIDVYLLCIVKICLQLILLSQGSSCRKVMFLHLSVSHSVHRGMCDRQPWADTYRADTPLGRHPQSDTPLGRHSAGRHPSNRHHYQADSIPGQTPPGQTPPAPGQTPPEMATAADGMHPI